MSIETTRTSGVVTFENNENVEDCTARTGGGSFHSVSITSSNNNSNSSSSNNNNNNSSSSNNNNNSNKNMSSNSSSSSSNNKRRRPSIQIARLGQEKQFVRLFESDLHVALPTEIVTNDTVCTVKILLDDTPQAAEEFHQEYNLLTTTNLKTCPCVTHVLLNNNNGNNNEEGRNFTRLGQHEAYFVEAGSSIKEWWWAEKEQHQQQQQQDRVGGGSRNKYNDNFCCSLLGLLVRVAADIAHALSMVHSCGIVHNALEFDSIVVTSTSRSNNSTDDDSKIPSGIINITIKLTNFGRAVVSKDITEDLKALGRLYHNMLKDFGDDETADEVSFFKRSDTVSLRAFSCLARELENGTNAYTSAMEVEADLRYLLNHKKSSLPQIPSKVDFLSLDGNLYGRSSQKRDLLRVYTTQKTSSRPQLVLVSGNAGSGKSSLVRDALRDVVNQDGGFFLEGAFEKETVSQPYEAILGAFSMYIDSVLERKSDKNNNNNNNNNLLIRHIQQNLEKSNDANLLLDLMPSLRKIFRSPNVMGDMPFVKKQFLLVFGSFVRAVSHADHPIVLFLDNLQWVDGPSLQLIETFLTDRALSSHILVVGAYRNEQEEEESPRRHNVVAMFQQQLEERHNNIDVSLIALPDLTKETVNEMMCDILDLPPRMTSNFTDLIYRHTKGNILFLRHFLSWLQTEKLLSFEKECDRWTWNEEDIEAKDTSNLVELMSRKIEALPQSERSILKLASCLGPEADISCLFWDAESEAADVALKEALKSGLVGRSPRSGLCKFKHNYVQQAAYGLIPPKQKTSFHLQTGRRLWTKTTQDMISTNLFLIVNQLNKGARRIKDQAEIIDVARLNLHAGEKAMQSSAFGSASIYFQNGLDLLGDDNRWKDNFELCLALTNAAAEAEYCRGNLERMNQLLHNVFSHTKNSIRDRVRAYVTRVNALGASSRAHEAFMLGLEALRELGRPLPPRSTRIHAMKQLFKTSMMLRGKTDAQLLNLPQMTDELKLATMQILSLMFVYCIGDKPEFGLLILVRILQMTLKDGICGISSLGFAFHGVLLCSMKGDYVLGYRYGELALAVVDKFQSKSLLPRVLTFHWAAIHHWTRPVRDSLAPLMQAHKVALETGDMEFAMLGFTAYQSQAFCCGTPLRTVEQETTQGLEKMLSLKQRLSVDFTKPILQRIHNLLGRSADPCVLTGEIMNQEESIEHGIKSKNNGVVFSIYVQQFMLCVLFGDYESAETAKKGAKKYLDQIVGMVDIIDYNLMGSILAIEQAKKSCWRCGLRRAQKHLTTMKKWALSSPRNFSNVAALIEAEIHGICGRHNRALAMYRLSIDRSKGEGFIHLQAIGCERAGLYLKERGDEASTAAAFLRDAIRLYEEWGAQAKADHLTKNMSTFLERASLPCCLLP